MSLHEMIYRLRTERSMSQLELAEALDVSRQSISKWETGAAVPELDKLVKLSDVFGITLDELVRGTAEVPPKEEPRGESHPQPAVIIERQGLELHRIIALAVLCLGGVAGILFLVFGGPRSALLAAPIIAVGVLFLLLPKRHAIWGCWVVWIAALLLLPLLTGGSIFSWGTSNVVLATMSSVLLVALVPLIIATVRRLKR